MIRGGSREVRSFVALELPESLKNEIAGALDKCRMISAKEVKWVEFQNLHFTLQFFGSVNEDSLSKISHSLKKIFSNLSSFAMHSATIELYPRNSDKYQNPRIIWVRCSCNDISIENTVCDIQDIMEDLSLPIDKRPFKMHITLGRVKRSLSAEQIIQLSNINLSGSVWTINKATLYESRLNSHGPEYFRLCSYELKNSRQT